MREETLIYTDELSGVFNRRYFRKLKEEVIPALNSQKSTYTVVITDIDHFKEINDIHGHLVGDKAIKFFAEFLKNNLRSNDIIIRYGGDEFVVLQKGLSKNDAFLIWQRIIKKLKAQAFHKNIRLSMSVGLASFPEDNEDFEQLFKQADSRLYLAKRSGRGRVGIEQAKSIKIPPMKFVNRTREIDTLTKSIEHGAVTIVRGEAGIGKTRFVREVLSTLRGIDILWGDCLALEHKIPYYPLRELLRYRLSRSKNDILKRMPTPLKIELGKIIPDILSGINTEEIKSVGETVDRYRLFEGFKFVFNFGANQKIIVVDNIQWIDDDSIEALKYIIRGSNNTIFVFMSRIEEISPKVEEFLQHLSRESTLQEILLSPLTDQHIREVVSIIMGESVYDLENYIASRSAGNTFYAEELLKALYEEGYLYLEGDSWVFKEPLKEILPRGVNDLTRRKFELLSPQAKELLKLLSVARKGYLELLVDLSGLNEGIIFDIIEEGIKKGLLIEDSDDEYVSFRAEILRHSLYTEELSSLKRRHLHRKVAEWLNKNRPKGNEEEIAYHYFMGKDREKIIEYGEIAGDKARKIYSNHEALKYYTWTKDALKPNLEVSSEKEKRHYIQILSKISTVLLRLGKLSESEGILREAVQLCERYGFNDLLAQNLDSLAGALLDRGEVEEALSLTRKTIKIAREKQLKRELMEAYNTLGILLDSRGNYKEAMKAYEKALSLSEELDDDLARARILNDIGLVYQYTGDFSRAIEYFKEVEKLFTKHDAKDGIISIKINISLFYEMQRDLENALKYAKEALDIVNETGSIIKKATVLNDLGIIYLDMGEFESAEKYLLETLKINKMIGDRDGIETSYINLGIIYGNRGQIDRAIALFKNALDISIEIKDIVGEIVSRINLGSKLSLLGKYEEAKKLIQVALTESQDSGLKIYSVESLMNLAEISLRQREYQKAISLLIRAIETARDNTSLKNKTVMANILLAKTYLALKKYDDANRILNEIEPLLNDFEAAEHRAKFLLVKMDSLIEQRKIENAKQLLSELSDAVDKYRDAVTIGEYNTLLGKLALVQGDRKSEEYFKKAYEIFSSMGLSNMASTVKDLENNWLK